MDDDIVWDNPKSRLKFLLFLRNWNPNIGIMNSKFRRMCHSAIFDFCQIDASSLSEDKLAGIRAGVDQFLKPLRILWKDANRTFQNLCDGNHIWLSMAIVQDKFLGKILMKKICITEFTEFLCDCEF